MSLIRLQSLYIHTCCPVVTLKVNLKWQSRQLQASFCFLNSARAVRGLIVIYLWQTADKHLSEHLSLWWVEVIGDVQGQRGHQTSRAAKQHVIWCKWQAVCATTTNVSHLTVSESFKRRLSQCWGSVKATKRQQHNSWCREVLEGDFPPDCFDVCLCCSSPSNRCFLFFFLVVCVVTKM